MNREVYREYSGELGAHDFIAAMLQAEDEVGEPPGAPAPEESDGKVQDFERSFQDLGFSESVARKNARIFRRHSSTMGPHDYIAAMLQAEDEAPPKNGTARVEFFA